MSERMSEIDEQYLRDRLHALHEKGGGQEGMAVPFDDGEVGVVVFQIHDKDGRIKSRAVTE